ncbi:MAG: exo-alpha-sialidase [Bacteroidales bacterium]|nr:exo-alpha-sialidase [Bacteroidales bacterium]
MIKLLLLSSIFILGTLLSQAQWQPDVRLTNDPSVSQSLSNRCVASSGDTVHVVWRDFREVQHSEIYYKRTTDGGVSWGQDIRLTIKYQVIINGGVYQESLFPSVAVSGPVVHVLWVDERDGNYEIYYKRSTDGGTSWGTDTRLTDDPGSSWGSSVTVSGSTVHVIWSDDRDGNDEIYYKRSTDSGANWGPDTRLTNNSVDLDRPSVTVSGSDVFVAWADNRDGNYEIYYKRSSDTGLTWGSDTRLTNNPLQSYSPAVSVIGSTVNVVWEDDRNGNYSDIYLKRSTDAGISWGTDTRLTNSSPHDSHNSSVAASGAVVSVVWYDNRDGNYEIYCQRSTDGGASWGADTRLTNNFGYSQYPSIALSGTAVHVVWQESRDGNDEIYYKRNPTGDVVGLKEFSSTDMPFIISPNPASREIKVRSLENINEITVIDMHGKEIYQSKNLNPGQEFNIPTFDFPVGIYFIQVKKGKSISVQKFIKQ